MSYDLYFTADAADRAATRAQIEAALRTLAANRQQGDQILHDHPNTNVHFVWDLLDPATTPDDRTSDAILGLCVNYARPSFFILEALTHTQSLLGKVPLTLTDPQLGQSWAPGAPFPMQDIIDSYLTAAKHAAHAMQAQDPTSIPAHRLPEAKLIEAWRWNMMVDRLQASQTEPAFVPKIQLLPMGDTVHTAALWPDGSPILIPKVDSVILFRRDTAPKPGFLQRREDIFETLSYDDFLTEFGPAFTPSATSFAPEIRLCTGQAAAALPARIAARPAGGHFRKDGRGTIKTQGTLPMYHAIDAEFFA